MIKTENVEVVGWENAIRGCRNPLNSWENSDSVFCDKRSCNSCRYRLAPRCYKTLGGVVLGDNDLSLMKKLAKAGTDHRKFMRMIVVYVDIVAPLYWWKEFDTYKVGTVRNSCSTMHKIAEKDFALDDFSHEHLGVTIPAELNDGDECYQNLWESILPKVIESLNIARTFYANTEDKKLKKEYWWQMIQLLPSSYNQRSTVMLNYEVLTNIYHSRKNHKLDEWHTFCTWIETLPYSELITGNSDLN